MTNTTITSIHELRRFFGYVIIDEHNYLYDFEDVCQKGAENLLDLLRKKYHFEWGQQIPDDLTGEEVFGCISQYEVEDND